MWGTIHGCWGIQEQIQGSIRSENIGILKAVVMWTPEQPCLHAPFLGSATLFPGIEHSAAVQGGRQAGVEEWEQPTTPGDNSILQAFSARI